MIEYMDNFNPKLTALALVLNVEENLEDIFRLQFHDCYVDNK